MTSGIEREATPRSRAVGIGILLAFFVSGMCGLIHEVAWSRLLRLVMGNTTFSITTVLCAFMGGLALGSYLGGRIIDRRNDPLRVFAIMEGAIALYCVVLPNLIDAMQPIYQIIYQNTQTSFYVLSIIRFCFCFVLLIVPTTLMGATLPVLSRFFVRSSGRVGWSVGRLYAINTFGAVLGASGTSFVLFPLLGVSKTIYFASLMNGAVCITAYLLQKRTAGWDATVSPEDSESIQPETGGVAYPRAAVIALLIGYGLSGAAAMVYEIAWTRILSLMIGSSAYAFSMMLTAFILGLAVGSMGFARFVDRQRDPMRTLAIIEIGIAASSLGVAPFIGNLPFWTTSLIAQFSGSFWVLQAAEFGLILLIMLVPTTLMGAAFPVAARIIVRSREEIGKSVGSVYAYNTFGAIIGSFLGGFILIPLIEIQDTIVVAVLANLTIGVLFLALSPSIRPVRRASISLLVSTSVIIGIVALPEWNDARMTFAPYIKARRVSKELVHSREAMEQIADSSKIIFHEEALGVTITVTQTPDGDRTMLVNGKPDASTAGDLDTQILLAHLPLLIHPEPKSVLVVGLASGITLGSAGLHSVKSLDCAEISQAVTRASRLFDAFNHSVLDDRRVNLIIEDGRNHVALTDRKYDVITSEPSNPWIAGIADLFTKEFFQLCHDRLNPRGLACIWLEGYNLDSYGFRSVVKTFQSVFPETTIWNSMASDYLLIGVKGQLSVDYDVLSARMSEERLSADLLRIGVESPVDLIARLVMAKSGVRNFASTGVIHTDDNALLEFSTPRNMASQNAQAVLHADITSAFDSDLSFLTSPPASADELAEAKKQASAAIKAERAFAEALVRVTQNDLEGGIGLLRETVAARPRRYRPRAMLADLLLSNGLYDEALVHCREAALQRPKDAIAQIRLADALRVLGKHEDAIARYRKGLELNPSQADAHTNLARVLKTVGMHADAISHHRQSIRLNPQNPDALFFFAATLRAAGQPNEAKVWYRRVMQLAPGYAAAFTNLANILADEERYTEAINLYRQAIEANPNDGNSYYNIADALSRSGDFQAAIPNYRRAVELNPRDCLARLRLGTMLREQGRVSEAVEVLREALQYDMTEVPLIVEVVGLLATHPDEAVRDGRKAVKLAEDAAKITNFESPVVLDVLAAAYAEAGRFDQAIIMGHRALALAAQDQTGQLAGDIGKKLQLYERAKPYRRSDWTSRSTSRQ
jgi:spermidine synthase